MNFPKKKIHSRPVESKVQCKKVSKRVIGGKVKKFLNVFKSDKNFSSPIIGVDATVVNGDYKVCKELINELKVIGVIKCDKRDKGRVNKKLINGE